MSQLAFLLRKKVGTFQPRPPAGGCLETLLPTLRALEAGLVRA